MKRRRRAIRTIEGAARATDSRLPLVRVFVRGEDAISLTPRSATTGWYDFADDVRELVCEEIRPGLAAEWCDARERIGV